MILVRHQISSRLAGVDVLTWAAWPEGFETSSPPDQASAWRSSAGLIMLGCQCRSLPFCAPQNALIRTSLRNITQI